MGLQEEETAVLAYQNHSLNSGMFKTDSKLPVYSQAGVMERPAALTASLCISGCCETEPKKGEEEETIWNPECRLTPLANAAWLSDKGNGLNKEQMAAFKMGKKRFSDQQQNEVICSRWRYQV